MKLTLRGSEDQQNTVELIKNTNGDKINAIHNEIAYLFTINGMTEHAWYEDHDDNYVYFEMWSEQDRNYSYWKIAYTYDGVKVTITEEEATQGIMQKQWKDFPKKESVDKSQFVTLNTLEKMFHKHFKSTNVIKALNEEKMISIEPLYSVIGQPDLHGDLATPQAVNELITEFNKAVDEGYLQAGLFHKHKTNSFHYKHAWLVEEDSMYGDTLVKAGTPLVEVQFTNEKAWELKKAGILLPPSIGAQGKVEDYTDE